MIANQISMPKCTNLNVNKNYKQQYCFMHSRCYSTVNCHSKNVANPERQSLPMCPMSPMPSNVQPLAVHQPSQAAHQPSQSVHQPQQSVHHPSQSTHHPSQAVHQSSQPLQHINLVLASSPSEGALLIGDIICTLKVELLHNNQIGALLSCMPINRSALSSEITSFKSIPAHDDPQYPLHLHFEECADYVNMARNSKLNILVHCHAGVSRSVAIVCAYLIKYHHCNPYEALSLIRSKRQRAKPNQGFWEQLQAFHMKLTQRQENQSQPRELQSQPYTPHDGTKLNEGQSRKVNEEGISRLTLNPAERRISFTTAVPRFEPPQSNCQVGHQKALQSGEHQKKPRIPFNKNLKKETEESKKVEGSSKQKDSPVIRKGMRGSICFNMNLSGRKGGQTGCHFSNVRLSFNPESARNTSLFK